MKGREAQGGAIYTAGPLTLLRSTISGNRSEYYGGALYAGGRDGSNIAKVELSYSTVAANRAERLPTQNIISIDKGPVFIPAR